MLTPISSGWFTFFRHFPLVFFIFFFFNVFLFPFLLCHSLLRYLSDFLFVVCGFLRFLNVNVGSGFTVVCVFFLYFVFYYVDWRLWLRKFLLDSIDQWFSCLIFWLYSNMNKNFFHLVCLFGLAWFMYT